MNYEDLMCAVGEINLPDKKERRRYALLQAAATIFADPSVEADMLRSKLPDDSDAVDVAEYAVLWAEELLREIEKREKET